MREKGAVTYCMKCNFKLGTWQSSLTQKASPPSPQSVRAAQLTAVVCCSAQTPPPALISLSRALHSSLRPRLSLILQIISLIMTQRGHDNNKNVDITPGDNSSEMVLLHLLRWGSLLAQQTSSRWWLARMRRRQVEVNFIAPTEQTTRGKKLTGIAMGVYSYRK